MGECVTDLGSPRAVNDPDRRRMVGMECEAAYTVLTARVGAHRQDTAIVRRRERRLAHERDGASAFKELDGAAEQCHKSAPHLARDLDVHCT